ncbi:MAG: acyltransferase family protein [Novosphingobium sp.]
MGRRLYGLDGLRGIAALLVLAMHTFGFAGGHLAVDFFFMLSGYVMARTYEQRLLSGTLSPGRFMVMRLRRLWPTMAIGATLGLAVAALHGVAPENLAHAYAFALLMIPASATLPYALNLPAWSIFYELVANALHGAVFVRLGRGALIAVTAAAGLTLAAICTRFEFPRILDSTTAAMQVMIVPRVLASYLIGVLLYRLFKDEAPFRIPFAFAAAGFAGYVALVSAVPFSLWPLPFVFLFAPLLVLAGVGETRQLRALAVLGDISFPLYAVHFPVLQLVSMTDSGRLAVPLAWAGSIGLALLWTIRKGGGSVAIRKLALT